MRNRFEGFLVERKGQNEEENDGQVTKLGRQVRLIYEKLFQSFQFSKPLIYIFGNFFSSQNSRKVKSQDVASSFEEKDKVDKPPEPPKAIEPVEQPQNILKVSSEEMKKKQAKKDEDPRISKFKNAEVKV
jgi:hypothetical protein